MSAAWQLALFAEPELPPPETPFESAPWALPSTHLWFRSGTNHPGEIRGTYEAGYQVGVSVSELGERALSELARWAEQAEARGLMLFIDSGAFGEVEFDPAEGRLVPTRPISLREWGRRLDVYDVLAETWGRRCFVVAPDQVGSQPGTLERLSAHSERLEALCERGANLIVPLQRGDLGMDAFAVEAIRALGFNRLELVWGVPCKKGATCPAELRRFAAQLAAIDHPFPRFHLLGLAPGPHAHPGERYLDYLGAIRQVLPDASVSCDSVRLRALVGRGGGKTKPRALTLAQDQVRREGLVGITDVKAEAVRRVFAAERLHRAQLHESPKHVLARGSR